MAAGRTVERSGAARSPRHQGNGHYGTGGDGAHGAAGRADGARSNGGAGDEVTREDLELLLQALRSARDGDLDVRLPARRKGLAGDLNRAFNELAERRESLGQEVARVGRLIGREGRLTERASTDGTRATGRRRSRRSTC